MSKYLKLVKYILDKGEDRETRNGKVKSVFGRTIEIKNLKNGKFCIPAGRYIHYPAAIAEFNAFINEPKTLKDFEDKGCNYWKKWANEDGTINVDYGNAWFNYYGINQLANVIKSINNNPTDRRILIDAWRPDKLNELSLPCCHYAYQFYVDLKNKRVDMMWHQRSVDVVVGLPYDIILAQTMLCYITMFTPNYTKGNILMTLGDCHIYEEHFDVANKMVERLGKPTYPNELYDFGFSGGGNPDTGKGGIEVHLYGYSNPNKYKVEVKA
ncbi:TPA: hypothetical protein R4958_001424 [Campylobacter jejuni]|nr:hypothetical protein [Campylobacter jejuni]